LEVAMIALKIVWFLVKWWFLIGAISATIYLGVKYLRQQLQEFETWLIGVAFLIMWPYLAGRHLAETWSNRRQILRDVFSPHSRNELGRHKKVACVAVVAIVCGMWMTVAWSFGGVPRPPTINGQLFLCTMCDGAFDESAELGVGRDHPIECRKCKKPAAWVKAECPQCQATFSYGLLRQQGDQRTSWKCPKCNKPLMSAEQPKQGK
jgi:hypothetical protein